MHQIIQTASLNQINDSSTYDQVYNGLDSCLTLEIFNKLADKSSNPIYTFERALQAPILEIMLRGFRVDRREALKGVIELSSKIAKIDNILQRYVAAIWDKVDPKTRQPINANSPDQIKDLLYTHMHFPEQYKNDKGVRKLSVDRDALEKLQDYLYARPIVNCLLAIRDLKKQKQVFETEIDSDDRWRTSYNIAGTDTGRLSSSSSSENTGSNFQNIDGALRHIFLADPGYYLIGIDLEQAESREVGWLQGILFDRWEYLDACYSGDLHTLVCKLTWKNLPWTGDPKKDREIAEQPFYRDFEYRFMAKKLGHGSNYYGKPPTLARHAKIPLELAEDFQQNYFNAFPGFPLWHNWVREQLITSSTLTTPWGRTRQFFDRAHEDATLRKAIAFSPQSSTADRTNLALYRIWKNVPQVQLLAQVHDAIYCQCPVTIHPNDIIPLLLNQIDIRLHHKDRELIVPGEAKIGYNLGSYVDENDIAKWQKNGAKGTMPRLNLLGLKKFKENIPDERITQHVSKRLDR